MILIVIGNSHPVKIKLVVTMFKVFKKFSYSIVSGPHGHSKHSNSPRSIQQHCIYYAFVHIFTPLFIARYSFTQKSIKYLFNSKNNVC